jgi:broad specificity phosphatase PhoE
MPEFFEEKIETKPEKEKMPESIITAYIIRHGESIADKTDLRRGLTERGKEQAKEAGRKIVEEIARETDPGTDIELRGFDSGMDRANQTLIEVVKVLTDKGYKVNLPYSTQELAQDKFILDEMEKAGLIRVYGKERQIKPEAINFLKPIKIPKEARPGLVEEAQRTGGDLLTVMMSFPPEKLKEIGVETPGEAYQRMKSGEERTNQVARFLRQRERRPKRVIHIAISHGYIMGAFLKEELGIKQVFKEENIPNCQGFRVDFTGKPGEKPTLKLWGEEIEKRIKELVKNEGR